MNPIKSILWAIVLLAIACTQENKQPNTATAPASPSPSSASPELIVYAATVDKLNIRDQPNKSGQVVAQLTEGELVEGTGEISSSKEEVTLRGVPYVEPYIKVTTSTSKNGWVFGGALQCIYAGNRAESPDAGKLVQLTGFLKTLDTKKLDSGKKAWDYVNSNFATATGSLADAACVLLHNFLFRMELEGEFYTLTEKVNWSDDDYRAIDDHKFDTNRYPLTKSLAENGFGLAQGEGMIFPIVDLDRLQSFFGTKVSPPMRAYLAQETAEQNRQAWDDGGILIPMEEMADRAAFWEKFNRDNPHFIRSDETRESERWMRTVLVNGADNTPMYNYENQEITEEYKKTWAYIQQKYPGTRLATVTKEISDLCAAEAWKRTKKVEDWQTKFSESEN